jgi:hypothetical protein
MDDQVSIDTRGLGDNRPPVREIIAERVADIPDLLKAENADLEERRDDLLAAFERAPEVITDVETKKSMSDFEVQIAGAMKNGKGRRESDKAPVLEAGRMIDGFYNAGIRDPLQEAKAEINNRITAFDVEQEKAERKRREEEAAKERAAAEAAEKAAEEAAAKVEDDEGLNTAIAAEEAATDALNAAAEATENADAAAADISRTRSQAGTVSSLRTTWKGELTDRDTLDLEALRSHIPEAALKSAINAFVKAGGRELSGARIYEHKQSVSR